MIYSSKCQVIVESRAPVIFRQILLARITPDHEVEDDALDYTVEMIRDGKA